MSFNVAAIIRRIAVLCIACVLAGCATVPRHYSWETRLRGDAIILLGELHDNAEHHHQRVEVLRRAFATGWRPAIAMEQFDRERQADIDRARKEKPRDARHVIEQAAPAAGVRGGNWNWDDYRPFVELALEYGVPLIAANLSNTDITKVVREGYASVFNADVLRELGLSDAVPAELQVVQENEIAVGHCNALPAKLLPAMARGQFARDAVMASIISRHAAGGVVLIAGNGHVRRDIGVPYWLHRLAPALAARTWAVGYLETGDSAVREGAFDAMVRTAAGARADPCIEFRQRMKRPG